MAEVMRIAICPSPNQVEVQWRPIPSLDDGKVLVKVALCGICGTDLDVWRGSGYRAYPYSPGHEFCGTVREIGATVTGYQIGQRVVINPNLGCGECEYCCGGKPNLCHYLKTRPVKSNGGLSEYVALDHRMVYGLPASVPEQVAPFVEPLSCALHAVRTAQVEPREHVVIFGAGTMGILTGLILRAASRAVTFVEPAQPRRTQAAELCGVRAVAPDQLARDGLGEFDVAVDCSGRVEAVSQAIGALRKSGRLVLSGLVGEGQGGPALAEVTMKELELKGAWLNPDTFEEAISFAADHGDALRALRTEVFRLDDITAAFERALSQHINRVLVVP